MQRSVTSNTGYIVAALLIQILIIGRFKTITKQFINSIMSFLLTKPFCCSYSVGKTQQNESELLQLFCRQIFVIFIIFIILIVNISNIYNIYNIVDKYI